MAHHSTRSLRLPGWRVTTDMLLRIGTHFLACHSFSLVIIPFLVVMPCHSVKRSEESRFSKYCLERLDPGEAGFWHGDPQGTTRLKPLRKLAQFLARGVPLW